MTTRLNALFSTLALSILATPALSQVEVNFLAIPAGTTFQINEEYLVTGAMYIYPGATIEFLSQGSLDFAPGSQFGSFGTEPEPVVIKGAGNFGMSGGISFGAGSTVDITHTSFLQLTERGLAFNGSSVRMDHVTFGPAYQDRYAQIDQDFLVVDAVNCTELIMDACQVSDFYARDGDHGHTWSSTAGRDGFPGDPGRNLFAVRAVGTPKVHITNSLFFNLDAGEGGRGGHGEQGVRGPHGDNGGLIDDNGHDGSSGYTGGDGADGGTGGYAYAVYLDGASDVLIAQNVFHAVAGGIGGAGGNGGKGGNGGNGGDGVNGVLWDGGNGGDGGKGGKGGPGGEGATGGRSYPVYIDNAQQEHAVINNTFLNITSPVGGTRGIRGARGSGGSGGEAGSAGTWGDPGADGSNGSIGTYGSYGVAGADGSATGLYADGRPVTGYTVSARNNVFVFDGASAGLVFFARPDTFASHDPDIDAGNNASTGHNAWSFGDVYGSPIPGVIAFGSGYAPAPTATAMIDTGNNNALPIGMDFDYAGNFRLMNDPLTPNTGTGSFPGDELIVDLGAVELDGWTAPCDVDLNADGFVDNGDIGTYITLFLAADPAADFNGDGFLDNGDIGAFIAAFIAGC